MRTRKTQAAQRLRAGSAWEENDLVFCQQNGRPLDPNGHSKAWKKFLAKPGIREGRLHDASHTAATLLPVQGVDQRTVKAIMGWSEVAMTKRYQHVVRELRREAAARMGEVLWGPTTTTARRGGETLDGRNRTPPCRARSPRTPVAAWPAPPAEH